MMRSNSTNRAANRRLVFAACLSASAIAFAAASTAPLAPAQTGQSATTVTFAVKQGEQKTDLKLVSERGELTKASATDADGTRGLKRLDKLTLPCKEADMKCETVELESGVLVGVCHCPDTSTALLLPAVQKVREAARRSASNTNTNTNTNTGGSAGTSLTKAGPGTLTLSGATAAQKQKCWGDEKLKLVVCPQ